MCIVYNILRTVRMVCIYVTRSDNIDLVQYPHYKYVLQLCVPCLVTSYIYNPGNDVTYLYTVTLAHGISNHNHCNVMYIIWFNMILSSDNFLLLYLVPKVSN